DVTGMRALRCTSLARASRGAALCALVGLAACRSSDAPERRVTQAEMAPTGVAAAPGSARGAGARDQSTFKGPATNDVAMRAAPAAAPASPVAPEPKPPQEQATEKAGAKNEGKNEPKNEARAARTRAWFPETFLFEPLVVTDDHGAAVVPVRVPDRLTTWRVLALAHSRAGAQAGAATSFLGTLPAYVDPVVPAFLIRGDTVRLPVQIVNTTTEPITSSLEIAAANASLTRGPRPGARTVPAQGSTVEYATLVADHPGTAKLRVALGGTDAVERAIEVRPAGRPVTQSRSGTLAAPRRFTTPGTPGADPATDRVRLTVFPGALAVLRAELGASTARSGVADDAYALLLAGKASSLLAALGDRPDPDALRALALVASQRAIRDGRTLDIERAALLAEAALAHPGNPVLARLGERAAAYLAQNQRPDGTFSGQTGWTLQRLLVVTAEAVRAAGADQASHATRQRTQKIQDRAAGAFARTAEQVTDGYTAAAILASGAVTGELAEALRKRVSAAIKTGADGAAYLEVGEGVVRADGKIPSRVEATALAVLALAGDARALAALGDLGTTLLGAYSLERGWGDGRVNLVAMQAVLALFKAPLPSSVTVTLAMDGTPVVRGTLEGAKLHDVLALVGPAPGLAGEHAWTLTAEPPVPGLGYSLALDSWLPWDRQAVHEGLELALPERMAGTVGKPLELTVTAVAPSGIPLHIQQALPAGVQVDTPSLEAQVAAGTIERFVAADGTLDLHAPALAPGKTFSLTYRVVPTLGGTLRTGASLIEAGAARFHVPPSEWTIQ
ncbi:MAG TPA: alpha-2-macroglobulin family protein, partial [Kofleriaceae bacterium]|nr:alpha-2-macroglobulin family protein [Kofleriaceae bacterium]